MLDCTTSVDKQLTLYFTVYLFITTQYNTILSHASTMLTRLCTKWFLSFPFSTKCSEWQKSLENNQVKIIVEHFFTSKPPEFYLWGIKKQPGNLEKAIQNNGQYKAISLMSSVHQWSGRPVLSPRSNHTKDSKNSNWYHVA